MKALLRIAAPLALAAAVAPAASQPGAPAPGPSPPPSILLVTVDTLRYDRTLPDGPMPAVVALARRGTSFTEAHAQTPLTLPSHATILTGLGAERHGVRDNVGAALPAGVPTVAEILKKKGWATGAFVSGYPLAREFGLARGFDVYDDRMTRTTGRDRDRPTERPASQTVARALEWLAARGRGSVFLWVHLYEPHDPYEPPEPFSRRFANPYDGEAATADAALGELLGAVARRSGAWWIALASDHGESLGEHGEATHGVFLYESTLHVPLVIVPPAPATGRVSSEPVFLMDVAPTLLQAAGFEAPAEMQGRSLLPLVRSGAAGPTAAKEARAVYLETLHPRRRYGWAELRGVLWWPMKFIAAPRGELYDLGSDPAEARPIADPERSAAFGKRLAALAAAPRPPVASPSRQDLDRLASLGYTGGSVRAAAPQPANARGRPDPKDRVAVLPDLEAGLDAMASGDLGVARKRLTAALDRDPDNLVALNNLGILEMRAGRPDRAEALFRKGLEADPEAERLANDLGLALSRQGRHVEAVEAYRKALAGDASFTAARFNLGVALHRLGRSQEALQELERVRAAEPDFPGLRETLALVREALSERK